MIGELLFGAKNSTRPRENLEKYRRFVHHCEILPVGGETAELYAELKKELRSGGYRIPDNDVWIAAAALEHEAVLLTKDRHFSYIERLLARDW